MNKKLINYALFALMVLILTTVNRAQIAQGGNFSLEKSAITGGGQTSTGGVFSLDGAIGQAITQTSNSTDFTIHSGFFTPETLAPTAAFVSVSGYVKTKNGAGIRNVQITLTTADGLIHTTSTRTFGNYRFDNIPVGQIVILNITAKRFTFAQPTRVIALNDEITDIDFVGNEQ